MPNGYWDKNKCYEVSKDCISRSDFNDKYRSAYAKSREMGWLDEFFKK